MKKLIEKWVLNLIRESDKELLEVSNLDQARLAQN